MPVPMLVCRTPAPPLSSFVSVLWYASGWQPAHPRERHMPNGSAGLIIPLAGRAGSWPAPAILSGPRSESFVLESAGTPDTLIGAQFTHGGAAAFFDLPLCLLRNVHAPLRDVAGASSRSLQERLISAATAEERLAILDAWLRRRLADREGPDAAVRWAVRRLRHPRTRVRDVAAGIGRSSRWFIERFARDVGLTPKVFSRVQRFQAALRYAHRRPVLDLSDLAAAAGYFDQAHMAHDFSALAGMPPSAVLAGRTPFLNHVVDRT